MADSGVFPDVSAPFAPAADDNGNRVFPVPFVRFAASSIKGTSDEIWLGPLKRFHGNENHTPDEWHELINQMRDQPV